MVLIPAIALGGLALGFLLAPLFEVKLTKRIVDPVVVAAIFFAIALVFGKAALYTTDKVTESALGIVSGILGSLGLFLVVLGCARYALSQSESEEGGRKPRASKK